MDRKADQLRRQLIELTGTFVGILEQTVAVAETKEFGCERCPSCTLEVCKMLPLDLTGGGFWNPDVLISSLEPLVTFPHTCHQMLNVCCRLARHKRKAAEFLLNCLIGLCERCGEAFTAKKYLKLARIAAVLEGNSDEILSVYEDYGWGDQLRGRMVTAIATAQSIEAALQDSGAIYEERRYSDADGIERSVQSEKRVRGGGVLLLREGATRARYRVTVMDFSLKHLLGTTPRAFGAGAYFGETGQSNPLQSGHFVGA